MPSILHASLEYKQGVGGIKAVLMGLLPAQMRTGEMDVSVITPFYDVYAEFYKERTPQHLMKVAHRYKGKIFESDVFVTVTEMVEQRPILHYLIKPVQNSPVAWIFNIKNEANLYQAFAYSEPGNRIEYFVTALAALMRVNYASFPKFDILHAHAWHAGLAGFLMKEFENIQDYKSLIPEGRKLRSLPKIVSTVHMLTSAEHGQLTTLDSVRGFLTSVGLPLDLVHKFPNNRGEVQENYVKRVVLSLLYSDMVTVVSRGLAYEVTHKKAAKLESLFEKLDAEQRLVGITNGITVSNWLATDPNNVPEFYFKPNESISASKQKIKEYLSIFYPKLADNKLWYVFVGRFSSEKGMDMLLPAIEAIQEVGANLIIMGKHVAHTIKDGQKVSAYQELMDEIREKDGVVVIEDPDEQKQNGRLFRAAAQYMLSLSHNEACGLIPMEGLANAALAVAPNIQGLPDSVIPIVDNYEAGTGFLYEDDEETRVVNVQQAIRSAQAYYLARMQDQSLDALLSRLLVTVQEYDWDAKPAAEYTAMYQKVLARPLLTYDQIRETTAPAMLSQFATLRFSPFSRKIFQLGFNKCGSQTIHNFLCVNGVPALHYGNAAGSIAKRIQANHQRGEPLLDPEFDKFCGFFDMEDPYADPPIYIAPTYFMELDRQYPDSKFILNTRTKENWLASRCAHVDQTNGRKYVDVLAEKYGLTVAGLVEKWSAEWDAHHAAVLEYFKDRPNDLLIFNIETDSPQKICDFFADRFRLDPTLFGHLNKTPTENKVALALASA